MCSGDRDRRRCAVQVAPRVVLYRMADLLNEVRRLIGEKNYVGAGLAIRSTTAPEAERNEAIGLAVAAVIGEIDNEKNRERVVYLRSLLSWYFKEAPGLSYLYREQLKMANGRGGTDLASIFRFFRDIGASVAPGSGPDLEETAEKVKDFSERFKQRGEDFQDQVKDFFAQSGIDLDEGMSRANDFFEGFTGKRNSGSSPPRDADDE